MTPAEERAARWLSLCLLLVGVYASALVLAGPVLADLFEVLGFGAAEAGVTAGPARDYVLFLQGVLGAVVLGWTLLLQAVVRGPLRRGEPWAWTALVVSVGTWFVLDTGFSVAVGQHGHALFNVPFAVALLAPLWVLRLSAPRTATGRRSRTSSVR